MAESSAVVDLPVIVLQLGKESYCGPSISKHISCVIAIEARKVFSVKFYSAIFSAAATRSSTRVDSP